MPSPRPKNDALAVTQRLVTSINQKNRTLSPTALAKDFNLRWRGAPVTVNATRKWLNGESIPTMDKLAVLANMLDISEDWLRWGEKSMNERRSNNYLREIQTAISSVQDLERALLQDYRLLSPVHKKLMNAMSEVLLTEQIAAEKERAKK
jgi:transcriptional regulator with XRE-family HTH domain